MYKTLTYLLVLTCISFTAKAENVCDPNLSSLLFDGNSYVEFTSDNDLNISDKITVEAWIKANQWGVNSASGSIVCKHGWTNGEQGYVLRAGGNGELSFNIAGINNNGSFAGWKEAVSPANSMQLNTWHHVAGTFDGKKIKLYIDGTLIRTVNFKGDIKVPVSYNLRIGRIADPGAAFIRPWIGYIDEVRIWNKALSETQIRTSMNNHLDPATVNNLVGYWRFNNSSLNSIDDMGSGSNDGVCVNAVQNTDVPFTNGVLRPLIFEANGILSSIAVTGNQWNLNGVPILAETGMNCTPNVNGSYSVTVTDILGCTATSDEIMITTLEVEDISELGSIRYYIDGQSLVFISRPGNFSEYDLALYDLSGREMKSERGINDIVDLEFLSPGIYILALHRDATIFTSKIFLSKQTH